MQRAIENEGGTVMRIFALDNQIVGAYLRGGPPEGLLATVREEGKSVHSPSLAWRLIDDAGTPQNTLLMSRRSARVMARVGPWWILDPEANKIHKMHLPAEVDLSVVKDGYAYGRSTTERGAPMVVRYRIQEN